VKARSPRPAWQSIAFGIVIGLALAAAVVGGIVALVLFAHEGPVSPPTAAAPLPSESSVAAVPPASPTSAATASAVILARIDATLLRVLPPTIAGLEVKELPDAEQQATTDASLGRSVSRVATAFVVDAKGTNWAYTAVVDVRPAAETDVFFRDWQTTFDTTACQRVGGVAGHTQIQIGGRDVDRTACGGNVTTYHLRLSGTSLLISISEFGPAKFGEQELGALRP
jgi:hypothetical protein